jgi:hypothetical protein
MSDKHIMEWDDYDAACDAIDKAHARRKAPTPTTGPSKVEREIMARAFPNRENIVADGPSGLAFAAKLRAAMLEAARDNPLAYAFTNRQIAAALTPQPGDAAALAGEYPGLANLVLYHETGGHEGDGSLKALATAKLELAALTPQPDARRETEFSKAWDEAWAGQEPDAGAVERVARALCVEDGFDPDEEIIGSQCTGFETFGPLWQANERSEGTLGSRNYVRDARAAIAALVPADPAKGET